jgi:hypothetical protein
MNNKAFTLIEVLIGAALCLLVFLGIFGCYQLGLKVLGQSKARIIASAIATEKIEKLRSLPYYQIGTYECGEEFPECDPEIEEQIIPGYPQGLIKKSEHFTRNNMEFLIDSVIEYGINCSDGVGKDECPNDYKKIKIQVSWFGRFGGSVVLDSLVSPTMSAQECQEKGGFLVLSVYDAYGENIVAFPEITIENTETSEIKTAVPEDGKHCFVLDPGSALYKILITKAGYTQEQTYKSNDFYQGTEIINTQYPYGNPNISEGENEERTYYIGEHSNFNIQTLLTTLPPIPIGDVSFSLLMESDLQDAPKIIGSDTFGDPIYKYNQTHSTDSSGILNLSAMEFGKYVFSDFSVGGVAINLREDLSPQPIVLGPGVTQAVEIYLQAMNNLLVYVKDKNTSAPLFSAQVRLSNSGLGYDKTQFTDTDGRTLFIPLETETYYLEAVAVGYATSTDNVAISGSVEKIFEMEQL